MSFTSVHFAMFQSLSPGPKFVVPAVTGGSGVRPMRGVMRVGRRPSSPRTQLRCQCVQSAREWRADHGRNEVTASGQFATPAPTWLSSAAVELGVREVMHWVTRDADRGLLADLFVEDRVARAQDLAVDCVSVVPLLFRRRLKSLSQLQGLISTAWMTVRPGCQLP
jgi:hypothetical protein